MASFDLKVDNRGVCPEFEFEREDTSGGFLEQRQGTRVFIGEAMGYQQPRGFTLRWDKATEGEVWLVKDLFGKVGTTGAMNYIPPDETAIVEVVMVDLRIVQKSAVQYGMNLTVEEAF